MQEHPHPRHLLVDISAHGYGHAAMTAPVINELARRIPDLRITVRTAVPHEFLKTRLTCTFWHIPAAFDFGMRMASAIEVQVGESAAAYRAFHADWRARVAREADAIRTLGPDLVLANVPYLSLAAARQARVPAVGMCCLNWADIYRHYLAGEPSGEAIHAQILEAYRGAAAFLRVQPAMPMSDLDNVVDIGPITRIGRYCRAEIAARLPQSVEEKLVMVAMGGIEFRLPVEHWPRLPGVRWLIPQEWGVARHDMTALEPLGLSFSDALASCDAVLTKPGYGTFTEAAYAGIPVLYVSRRDWPEEPHLVAWLRRYGACLEVERECLWRGELQEALARLWRQPKPPRPEPGGAVEAAALLERYF